MSILRVEGLTHAFGSFLALKGIDISLQAGEVVGILGENGAGKSTLLNVFSGTLRQTAGTVALDGVPLRLGSYHEANRTGIWRIFQDPALIPNLPVYENLFLGHEKQFVRAGLLDTRRMVRLARELVAAMGLPVDVRDLMMRYDFATRQALEVGRATLLPKVLGLPAGFVLFDEPTTGLTRAEVIRLLERMRDLRRSGAGVAFVSHRLQEVFDVCDRLIVLKDGAVAGAGPIGDFDEDKLHRLMVGRDGANLAQQRAPTAEAPVRLDIDGLGAATALSGPNRRRRSEVVDITFQVKAGEIVGIGGLLGSGKGQLLRLIVGIAEAQSGTVRLDGTALNGPIASRIRAGLGFVSGDRPSEAVIVTESVAANVSLPSGHAGPRGFSNLLGVWRTGAERRITRALIADLGIKATPDQKVRALSGGNQQKVALARWIHRDPKLLLIENPTAGVDVGAKAEIYRRLRGLADAGLGVLVASSELPELIGLCDRIVVMKAGRTVHEFGPGPDEDEVRRMCEGLHEDEAA